MRKTFRFFEINYDDLTDSWAEQLFSLRKKTFHDRMSWDVTCTNGQEIDEYDNSNTTYLVGFYQEKMICSTRVIEIRHPNMITGVFYKYFSEINLKEGNYLEASRFFVDKARAAEAGLQDIPISHMLFLSMITYSMRLRYDGFYAIVSRQMCAILRRSGWQIEIINEAYLSPSEKICLVYLNNSALSRKHFIEKLSTISGFKGQMLYEWPLIFTLVD